MENNFDRINANGFEVKTSKLWWQKRGLRSTTTGFGKKIPTDKMIKFGGRWRRIYCTIYSNSGMCWILCKGKTYIIEYL